MKLRDELNESCAKAGMPMDWGNDLTSSRGLSVDKTKTVPVITPNPLNPHVRVYIWALRTRNVAHADSVVVAQVSLKGDWISCACVAVDSDQWQLNSMGHPTLTIVRDTVDEVVQAIGDAVNGLRS